MASQVQALLVAFAALVLSGCAAHLADKPNRMPGSCADGVTRYEHRLVASLPSWADGTAKTDLLNYLVDVTCPDRKTYVHPEARIAAFDLDGTLIPEKPDYFEVLVALERLIDEAEQNPTLKSVQPYKAAIEDDREYINGHGAEIVTTAAGGETLASFRERAARYLRETRHPTLGETYDHLFYRPMVELITVLQDIGFEVYIVSGSQQEYVRSFSEACLGIDTLNVIGSMIAFELDTAELDTAELDTAELDTAELDTGRFIRQSETWQPSTDHAGKVYRIRERTGALPVLYFGNSAGDEELLNVTASMPGGKGFLLNHDDPGREFEYGSDELLDLAQKNGWTLISMKEDFKSLYTRSDCLNGAKDSLARGQ